MRASMMIAGALLLTACGAATVATNETTANAATPDNTARVAVPVAVNPTPRPTTSRSAPIQWAGHYEGAFEGGDGAVTIMTDGKSQHLASLSVAGHEGCAGEISGDAFPRGGKLILAQSDGNGGTCTVSMTKKGQTLTVTESGCSSFHGASCAFSGTARFKHATDSLEPDGDTD